MKRSKMMKKLDRRRKDYDLMMARSDFKAPLGAYHRPGSNKK